jgi:uncharacterized protein (TIGR02246 family)
MTLCFLLVLLLASPAPAATANPNAAVQKAIDAGNAAYIAAWERGDADAYAALFDEVGDIVRGSGAIVHGRTAVHDYQKKVFSQVSMTKGTITTTDLVVDGDTAYEIGKYEFSLKPASGSAEVVTGRYLTIWGRQADGSWKIKMDSGLTSSCA